MTRSLVAVGDGYTREVRDAGMFAVVCAGLPVPVLDLDPEHVATIARAAGVSWTVLVETPTADLAVALALVVAAEDAAGCAPDRPATVAGLLARFVRIDEQE